LLPRLTEVDDVAKTRIIKMADRSATTTLPQRVYALSQRLHSPTPRGGRCRIRIYLSEESQDAPVVICSKLAKNGGTSITYAAEQLAAEVIRSLSHEETASVPLAGGTAYEALVRRLALRVGETVLIHGGAGGVGSFAVQIPKAAGARVLATAGSDNQEILKELGADVAIDYSSQNVTEIALDDTGGVGVDAVFDAVGGGTIVESIPATKPFGRLATILGAQGDLTPC
jgi:NADPH:quinone reductase-like Zn-dependent oxidoreductase